MMKDFSKKYCNRRTVLVPYFHNSYTLGRQTLQTQAHNHLFSYTQCQWKNWHVFSKDYTKTHSSRFIMVIIVNSADSTRKIQGTIFFFLSFIHVYSFAMLNII